MKTARVSRQKAKGRRQKEELAKDPDKFSLLPSAFCLVRVTP
jgi:hypothetical protein